ncbi:T9SS type A sorting domain-containing protein [Halalkalibaculum sp. DA3122]|uniref:T9SS type A sorting domain-containing protein n=1 Tax=Halalkalibaculum sp. DA3122 TaxID=3373607 RepID=UPI003753FDE2
MKLVKQILPWMAVACLTIVVAWIYSAESLTNSPAGQERESERAKGLSSPGLVLEDSMNKQEKKAARAEYFFRMLRDPATNSIPVNIRARELSFARLLPQRGNSGSGRSKMSTQSSHGSKYAWNSAGPRDVGGRTRALGIDQRNSDIIIAGGVSGGIWKSTDGGDTWEMKTDPSQNMSVSYLTQDPNNPDTWYYASGEFIGNSASDRSQDAAYFGTGIYRSTDNGETWAQVFAETGDNNQWNSPFDYISKIEVNPATGSVFFASNGFGIFRSSDGTNYTLVKGESREYRYSDFDIAPDGTIVAVLSTDGAGLTPTEPGVHISTDDGDSWTEITPDTFPNTHLRSVSAFAPSDPSIFYVFSYKGGGNNQGISFHRFTLNEAATDTISTDDRSANIPDFGEPVGGVDPQGGYNMVVHVKPDDPDYVLVGGINLFRSADGFATGPDGSGDLTKTRYWIGGYARSNDVSLYENQHPDQHIIAFDPADDNRMWSGHDGGVSLTENVTDSAVTWSDRNEGYITSQFYTVALPDDPENPSIVGGTQDNGSPYFTVDESWNQDSESQDASTGDGSYAYFTENHMFTSSQLGRIVRYDLEGETYTATAVVNPEGAQNQLFVHPYAVDPNNETVMYYPDVNSGTPRIWINTTIDEIGSGDFTGDGTSLGWENIDLDMLSGGGYQVTSLEVSQRPMNILYFGASSSSGPPRVFRAANASGTFDITEISIDNAASGAYVHDIALNPVDADEAIVVMSNYGITGVYHTTDGGSSWSAVEGNLSDNQSEVGPSIRSATIMPYGTNTVYLLGTSVGLFSTETLDGSSTEWAQENPGGVGNAVTEYVTSRHTDGTVALGTHGRGIFVGEFQGTFTSPGPPSAPLGLLASVTEDSVTLSWEKNPEVDIAGYNVYRGTQPNQLTLFKNVGKTTAVDKESSPASRYYAISAVDAEGNESLQSRPVAAYREDLPIDENWRLAGVPLNSAEGVTIPNGVNLIGFDGVYEIADEVEQGRGYWVKHSEPAVIEYLGSASTSQEFQLQQGWNLVSGIGDTISVNDIQDPNGVLSTTPVKAYSGTGYQDAQFIAPAGGYFIHAREEGIILMEVDTSTAASAGKRLAAEAAPVPREKLDALLFSRNGVTSSLMLSRSSLSPEEKQYYLMPPKSPRPVVDVRTSQGYRIVDQNETEIEISASSYPVQVQLSAGSAEGEAYRLVGINDGEEVHFDLVPGKSVTIGNAYDRLLLTGLGGGEMPLSNELSPNYPNPFNPSTTIEYQVAAKGMVNMEVYNLVGRKVQTLVNQVQNPGKYRVTFDGSNLSSGTYFLRIRAGDFQKVQKMTLIK